MELLGLLSVLGTPYLEIVPSTWGALHHIRAEAGYDSWHGVGMGRRPRWLDGRLDLRGEPWLERSTRAVFPDVGTTTREPCP